MPLTKEGNNKENHKQYPNFHNKNKMGQLFKTPPTREKKNRGACF